MGESTSRKMRSDLFPFAAMLVCMAAGSAVGQTHSGVVEGRRGMRQDEADPSKQGKAYVATSDGCTMIRMQGFNGQVLKFMNGEDFMLDNEFGWINVPGGSIPAKSMHIFQTADSMWYISEMVPPNVNKRTAIAWNERDRSPSGYVEDNSRWPGKPLGYPPEYGWAGSNDATPQGQATFTCMCKYKHPDECSDDDVPHNVSIEISLMAGIGVLGAVSLCVIGIYQTVRKRYYGGNSPTRSGETKTFDGYQIILQGSDKPPKEMMSALDASTRGTRDKHYIARESVRYMEECASGTFTITDSKENGAGVVETFILQWEKAATTHGGSKVAGGWCDESKKSMGSTEANNCCVCLDSETNVILKPCGHVEFCAMCIIGQACRWSSKLGPGCPVCRTPFDSIILSEGPLVKEDEAMPEIGPVAAAASLETQPPLLAWPQGDGAPTSVSGSMVYAMNRERVQQEPIMRGGSLSDSSHNPTPFETAAQPSWASAAARCYSMSPAAVRAVTGAGGIQVEGGAVGGEEGLAHSGPGSVRGLDGGAGAAIV